MGQSKIITGFRRFQKDIVKNLSLLLFVLPGLVVLAVNNYLPMFGVVMAFKRIDNSLGIFKSPFVGFENFKFLFSSGDAFRITRNTILYNLLFIFVGLVLEVTIAIAISELRNRVLSKVYQTIIILPYFLSFVVIGYVVYAFLSTDFGFINRVLAPLFGSEPVSWYSEQKYWPYIIVIINFWVYCAIESIIYLAQITSIDNSLYESAVIDGASKLRQIVHVTLPMLTPLIITLTILKIGDIFRGNFGLFYQVPLASPLLIPVTDVIDTYVYRSLKTLGDFGMVTAASLYQSVVGCSMLIITNFAVKRVNKDAALF